jgi:glutamate-1-semialdehyde 2,1-aminomutase
MPADKPYVQAIREVTEKEGILLIFDEVISGFRMGLSGASSIFGVVPDLRTLGKIIGGGFPTGAYGGRRDIMEKAVAPPQGAGAHEQKIFSSGTFSGNPVSMIAGLAMIKELEKPGFYESLDGKGERIRSSLLRMAGDIGFAIQVLGIRSVFTVHFSDRPLRNVRDIMQSDRETAGTFYTGLVANGVYIPDFHFASLSAAHSDEDVARVLATSEKVLREIKRLQS